MSTRLSSDHSDHRLPSGQPSAASPPQGLDRLPVPMTSLVGREREVAAVGRLLSRQDVRLVTLTGPGGVGKTRLSVRVAEELLGSFPDGAAFVPLASIRDPALVLPAIAATLGVREARDQPVSAQLVAHLRDRALLLVLDNLEQVPGAAPRIAEVLAACPGVKVLATSRSPLRVSGEYTFNVPPLSLPSWGERGDGPPPFEDLARSEAVHLFVERAQATRADFVLTETTAGAVAEVCRRVDGLPLAIELAAARVAALPPAALLARLETRLPVLAGGPRDAPQRLRTMRDAIGWSYDLLDEAEQRLFQQLAVFVGGFTLSAAEAVAEEKDDPAADVLTGITVLVDATLLRLEEVPEDEPRYAMLETVREFGLEQLVASGEEGATRDRHAAWCLALAERAEPELIGPEQRQWIQRLEREQPNLRAAHAWLTERRETELVLRLAAALWTFWFVRGLLREGYGWLTQALEAGNDGPAANRVRVLFGAGMLAWARGDFRQAEMLGAQARLLAQEHGLEFGLAQSIYLLFLAAEMQGRHNEAIRLGEAGVERLRACEAWPWLAYALGDVGTRLVEAGDRKRGEAWIAEGLALHRKVGNKQGLGNKLSDLGRVSHEAGDGRAAARHYAESLRLLWEGGDAWYLASPIEGMAAVAVEAHRDDQAARLLGAAAALRERSGATVWPGERGRLDRAVAVVRAALGEQDYAREMAVGRMLTLSEVVAEVAALADAFPNPAASAPPPSPAEAAGLSRREQEVLRLLAAGKSNPEIADALFIGRGTVKTHVGNLLTKLGAASRTEVAAIAHRRGLL